MIRPVRAFIVIFVCCFGAYAQGQTLPYGQPALRSNPSTQVTEYVVCACGQTCIAGADRDCPHCGQSVQGLQPQGYLVPESPVESAHPVDLGFTVPPQIRQVSVAEYALCQCGQPCICNTDRCCPKCGRPVDALPPHGVLVPEPSTTAPPAADQTSPSDVADPSTAAEDSPSDTPQPSIDDFASNDFGDFSPQSQVTTASVFAAVPPTIDLNFGGGTSTATVCFTQSFSTIGNILSGPPGSANSDLSFDSIPTNGIPDLLSVGTGRNELGGGIDTFDVAEIVPGSALAPPAGATFKSASATRSAGAGSYVDGEQWTVNAIFSEEVEVPNPSATVVGRLKIGENSSPIPRNRVFFNYSYFDDVRLRPEGIGVHRYSPGFEVLLDSNTSFELRTPFASTLASSFALDGASTREVEFGDLFMVFKHKFLETDNTLWSYGLGITAPTASNLNINFLNGTDLIRVKNQTVHLQPFLGMMLNLTDRLFMQGFLQVDVDVRGNRVLINPDPVTAGTVPLPAGKIRDATLFYTDISFGYWCRKRGEHRDKKLTSIVPMFEIHMSNTLEPNNTLTLGSVTLGNSADSVENLTFVTGCNFEVCNRHNLTLGYALPTGNRTDQVFDGELRVFWNKYL